MKPDIAHIIKESEKRVREFLERYYAKKAKGQPHDTR